MIMALIVAPVLTPAWAAPRPVPPKLREVPLNTLPGTSVKTTAIAPGNVKNTLLTAELAQPRFRVAGVALPDGSPPDTVVRLRIREAGTWGPWQELALLFGADPGSPDAVHSGPRVATEPITTQQGDGIQIRIDWASGHPTPRAHAIFIDPGRSPGDRIESTQQSNRAGTSTTAPPIITRARWGADESLRACGNPSYLATIKVGFVHHTVGSDNYRPQDSAAIVRGIYAYHVHGNGWCDIGYNFLVDKYGQIFEGRFGGMDRPVKGAHTGGFNNDSFAVSAMGNYETHTPTSALTTSLTQVLGWKLGLHQRTPTGMTTLVSTGGPNSRWPKGKRVSFKVISGHRDANYTACPGAALYSQLPRLRTRAADYARANSRRGEDVYGVLLDDTGSGKLEVHANDAATDYRTRMLDVATTWSEKAPQDWRFLIGSYSGDGRPDLIGLHLRNTDSGAVEISVATWASWYQESELLNRPLPIPAQEPDNPFQFAIGGSAGGDLYLIKTHDTDTNRVELHALTARSDYQDWILHTALPLATNTFTRHDRARFLVSRDSGDLYLVLHQQTGSRTSELHRLSADSSYQRFTVHAALPVGYTSDTQVQWLLGTAPEPDLFLVVVSSGESGRQEVHRLSAASGWSQWTLHSATDVPMITFPRWQVGIG